MLDVVPVGVCNSLVRLGKSLEADSCRGEPEPTLLRFRAAKLLTEALDFGPVKGDLLADEVFGSTMGDSPDRLMFKEPSALELGPMLVNYFFHSFGMYLVMRSDDSQVDQKKDIKVSSFSVFQHQVGSLET